MPTPPSLRRTQYSLLDGAIRTKELMPYLREHGFTACAITDHGFMGGVIEFYKACKANHIKPLLGIEAYITADPDNTENKTKDNDHLILLAKNNQGYCDLLRLASEAALKNFYYKPRIYREKLKQLQGNVIVTSACISGIVGNKCHWELDVYGRATSCQDIDGKIIQELDFYQELFQNDFYLEILDSDNNDNKQQVYNQFLLSLARQRNIEVVVTSDAHYLRREDHRLHEMLIALQIKKTLAEYQDSDTLRYGPYFWVKTPDEMLESARRLKYEQAYYNTIKIAEQCNVTIQLGEYRQPTFDITQESDYQEFLQWKASQ